MEREILLQKLYELRENLKNDNRFIEKTEAERESELESLVQARNGLVVENELLKQKLSDESNYNSFNYIKNQAKIYDITQSIKKLKAEKRANQATLKDCEATTVINDKELAAVNEILSNVEKELEQVSKEYRALGNEVTAEQDAYYRNLMNSLREDIEYLRSEIGIINDGNEYVANQVAHCNERNSQIDSRIEKYSKLLELVKERDSKNKLNPIDYDKKDEDERKLLQNQSMIAIIDNRVDALGLGLHIELEELISNVENGTIDDVSIILGLDRIKSLVLNKDYTHYEQDMETMQKLEANLVAEKTALEAKLSDEINYTPSVFAVEVMEEEIKNLETNMANCSSSISNVDSTIAGYEKSILDLETAINQYNVSNEKLIEKNNKQRLSMAITPDITDKQVNAINKRIAKNEREIKGNLDEIERLRKTIEATNLAIVLSKKQKKNLETIYNRDKKKLAEKTETLADRTTIDRQRLEEDQTKLAAIAIELSTLKAKMGAVEFDYESFIEQIISDMKEAVVVRPAQEEIQSEAVINREIANSNIVDEIAEAVNAMPFGEEQTEEPAVIIPVWKNAKDKVYEKIHTPEFIKKAKEFFKRAVIIGMGIVISLALLKACTDENISLDNNFTEIVIPDDRYEDDLEQKEPTLEDNDINDSETSDNSNDNEQEKNDNSDEEDEIKDSEDSIETPDNSNDNEQEKNDNLEQEPEQPIVPETPEKPEDLVTVTVKPGDSFYLETDNGNVVIDNSEGENLTSDYDFEQDFLNPAIESVKVNEDGTYEVTINQDEVAENTTEFEEPTQEEYNAYLEWLRQNGYSLPEETIEQGKTR